MTQRCNNNTYVLEFTDKRKGTIAVPRKSLIKDQADIIFVGKDRTEYGEEFDENLLHLLENFSAPELVGSLNVEPDTSETIDGILSRPLEGQTWFNSTKKRFYVYNKTRWLPLGSTDDVAGNRGVILSGESLPKPVSIVTGYTFDYSECSWNVSPFNVPGEIEFAECYTDNNAVVTMRYRLLGETAMRDGYANYQILGIRDNNNLGFNYPIQPSGTQPATPTPTPTPSISPSANTTPTVTPTNTRTPNITPTVTPTPSVSPGIEYFVFTSINDDLSDG